MPTDRQPRRPTSLALRVTTLVGATVTVFLIAFGGIVQRSIEHHFAEQDADELRVVAEAIQKSLMAPAATPDEGALLPGLEAAVSGHHGVFYRVLDSEGRVVYATPGADLSAASRTLAPVENIRADLLRQWQIDGRNYRGAALRMDIGTTGERTSFNVVVATATDFHLNYLAGLRRTLWLIILAACATTILAAWFAVHQGHAPLRRISARIRSITSDRLDIRLDPEAVPVELVNLVVSFNDMIGRMEDVFHRLSGFSADIAHELRTPITNLTTQTQVALGRARNVDEYREILYSSLEEYERMAKMIDDMLLLAKTDNGLIKPAFSRVDVGTEVQALFDYFEAWAEERGVTLTLAGSAPAIAADQPMLRRALSNLLSNAIRHTPPRQQVVVNLAASDSQVSISVVNPGPAIAPEHLPRLFDRFYRVDPSRRRSEEGSGLGLAIVKSIVDLHGGRIEVSSAEGRTCFRVSLPVGAPQCRTR